MQSDSKHPTLVSLRGLSANVLDRMTADINEALVVRIELDVMTAVPRQWQDEVIKLIGHDSDTAFIERHTNTVDVERVQSHQGFVPGRLLVACVAEERRGRTELLEIRKTVEIAMWCGLIDLAS